MRSEEKQRILDEYAATSRAFAEAVEQMRHSADGGEAFIHALAEAGTKHRASERSRIKLHRHLANFDAQAVPRPS